MMVNQNIQPYSQTSSSSSLLLSPPLISDGIPNHRQPELVIPNQNHNLFSRRQILPLAQISSDGQSTGSTNSVGLNRSANHGYYLGSISPDGRRISYSSSAYRYSNEGDNNVQAINYANPNPNPNPSPNPNPNPNLKIYCVKRKGGKQKHIFMCDVK